MRKVRTVSRVAALLGSVRGGRRARPLWLATRADTTAAERVGGRLRPRPAARPAVHRCATMCYDVLRLAAVRRQHRLINCETSCECTLFAKSKGSYSTDRF
ncbi:unnamed protein product [Colias eurytheme]|nr:unnamed protein product [Colias eurytheme]